MPNATVRANAQAMPIDRRSALSFLPGALGMLMLVPQVGDAAKSGGAGLTGSGDDAAVFQAIALHELADARLRSALLVTDEEQAELDGRTITDAELAEEVEASRYEIAAYQRVISTPPHTHAGAYAQLAHVAEQEVIDLRSLELFVQTLAASPFMQRGA